MQHKQLTPWQIFSKNREIFGEEWPEPNKKLNYKHFNQ